MTENEPEIEFEYFALDTLNGVEIQRPVNHDLSMYSSFGPLGKRIVDDPDNPAHLENPTYALRSMKYVGFNVDIEPEFKLETLIPYDTAQELAVTLFRHSEAPWIIEATEEGLVLGTAVTPICSIEAFEDSDGDSVNCWFDREYILGNLDEDEIEAAGHDCLFDTYELTAAVHRVGIDSISRRSSRAWMLDGKLLLSDEELAGEDYISSVESFTAPDGSQWRLIICLLETT